MVMKNKIEKPSERSDSKYTGVRKRKWGKWVSEIRLPNSRERIWLGSYDSAEKAARAFDAAVFCLRGRTAKFNFPDDPPEIDGGRSLSPPEIQAVAASYANSKPLRCHETQSMSESRVESPCASLVSSDETVQLDGSELMLDEAFLDLLMNTNMGSSNSVADYGIFPGFDDLHDNFLPSSMLPHVDYGENFDGILAQDSFLWNF